MHNLFENNQRDEESPLYSIHLDQLADKEYDDFLKCIDYVEEDPQQIAHNIGVARGSLKFGVNHE